MTKKKINILLVEDEKDHSILISRAFEPRADEINLTVVRNLHEAHNSISKFTPDLIIADYVLPDGKGIELLSQEKEESPYPVIIMTSHGDERLAVESMKTGALDYIVKSNEMLADMPRTCDRILREWDNITERRRIEETLLAERKFTETALDSQKDTFFVFDPSNGNAIRWNKAFSNISGYSNDEISSLKAPDSYYSKKDLEIAARAITTITKEGWAKLEMSLITKDGRSVPFEYHGTILKDKDGNAEYIVSIGRDITERKRTEETTQRLGRILDSSLNEIYVFDAETLRFIQVNKGAMANLGYSMDELLNFTPLDLKPGFTYEAFTKLLDPLRSGEKKKIQFETVHKRKDGSLYDVEVHLQLSSFESTPAFVAIILDVTERKRADNALLKQSHLAALGADVGVALTMGDTLQNMLYECTETFIRHLDAAFARIWTLNKEENILELQASAGMYTHIGGSHSRVPVGSLKIGLIAQERKPHLTNNVINDPRIGDREWAKREGMVAFAGYPLIVENRIVGVMAMFARKQLMNDTLDALASIADVIALGIERKMAEDDLNTKNSYLRLLQVTAVAANEATEIEEAFQPVLDEVCRHTGWPIGHVYVTSKDYDYLLIPTSIWHLEDKERFTAFYDITTKTNFAKGKGLPGRVLADSKPHWITDVTKDQNFDRAQIANGNGIKSAFGFPVMIKDEVVAVLEFFCTRIMAPDNSLLEIMADVGRQLGQVVERKRAVEQIHKLYHAVEQSPVTIVITDIDANIEYVNPKFTQLTGYTLEEAIGQNPRILKTDKTSPDQYKNLWEAITSGKEWHGEFCNKKKNGDLYWEHAVISPIRNSEGKTTHYLAVKEDITEQKQKDKLLLMQTRQAQMGEMLSMIAHQWRQPLTSIGLIAGVTSNRFMLNKIDEKEVINSLDDIQDHVRFLSRTISDFSNFFKPDKKKESANAKDIVQKCLNLVKASMEANKIKLETSYESERNIYTYPNELIQVFLSILKNTEDMVKNRNIENAKVVIKEYEEDGFIVIETTDNAGGIPEDIIDDIFLPYFSTKDEKQGTGLGLYMCKAIVEEHCKGEIMVQNVDGGTRVVIKLPIKN